MASLLIGSFPSISLFPICACCVFSRLSRIYVSRVERTFSSKPILVMIAHRLIGCLRAVSRACPDYPHVSKATEACPRTLLHALGCNPAAAEPCAPPVYFDALFVLSRVRGPALAFPSPSLRAATSVDINPTTLGDRRKSLLIIAEETLPQSVADFLVGQGVGGGDRETVYPFSSQDALVLDEADLVVR